MASKRSFKLCTGIWSARLLGASSVPNNPGLITQNLPVTSNRVQLEFFYLPNGSIGIPSSSGLAKGLAVEFRLRSDDVWMEGATFVVGEDFVNDDTIWNNHCMQLDLPAGPSSEIAFRFRVNGSLGSDQVFIDNVSFRVE